MGNVEAENFIWLGAGTVSDEGRVGLPDGVFDSGILQRPEDVNEDERVLAYWSFDSVDNRIILSETELTNEPPVIGDSGAQPHRFKPQKVTRPGSKEDNHRATIPSRFRKQSKGGNAKLADNTNIPAEVVVDAGDQLHFVTAQEWLDSETAVNSCLVLTTDQFHDLMGNDEGDGYAPRGPRFG
jgi:hypothetical protein